MNKKNSVMEIMQKWTIALIVLVFLGLPDGFAQRKKDRNKDKSEDEYIYTIDKRELDVQSLYIEALIEKEMGNIEDAVGLFQAVLKLDPDNHAAHYELSRIAYDANDLKIAEEYAEKAVRINPLNEWYHIYLAEARAHRGDYTGAARAYQGLVDAMPDKWEYLQDVGYMYAKAGEYEEAIRVYDELEEFEGITEPLSMQKQSIYIKMGKVEKAADEIRKVIEEFPDRENLYILLGEIYEANGLHKKALDSYEMLLELKPEHPQALLATAEIYRKSGEEAKYQATSRKVFGNTNLDIDTKIFMFIPYIQLVSEDSSMYEEVLSMAELILSVHPDDAKAVTAYADVLLNVGKQDEAIRAYQRATEYENCPITVWVQLFDLYSQNEQFGELISAGNQALEKFPEEVAPWFYLGAACYQVKDFDCVIEKYTEALKLNDVNPEIRARMWTSMGDAFNELGSHTRSDSCYEASLVINPNDAFTLNNFAYYLSLRDDQLEKAEKMSRRSNLLVEGNSAFLDTYAWIKYKQGDYKAALEWIEKAIEVMEQNGEKRPVLLEHYGDILFKLGKIEAALKEWNRALEAGGDRTQLEAKIKNKSLLE